MYISPIEQLISFIATTECALCKSIGNMLCLNCRTNFISELESRCYICNKLTKQHVICKSCRSKSRLRRMWWLGSYSGIIKDLISAMKLGRKRYYAREFGTILADALPYLPEYTLVIGVPTASSRRRMRGFDQAELLAQAFARSRGLGYIQPFLRTNQNDQIGKRRQERIRQMNHSLRLTDTSKIKGASILLIDDVLTTGATLEAAALLLRQNGAKHVDAAVIARHLLK